MVAQVFSAKDRYQAQFNAFVDVKVAENKALNTPIKERILEKELRAHFEGMFGRACAIIDALPPDKRADVHRLHDRFVVDQARKGDGHTLVTFTHGRDENGEVVRLLGPRWLSYLNKFERVQYSFTKTALDQ